MKKIAAIVSLFSLSLTANIALAKPEVSQVTNRGGHTFSLPAQAVEVAPDVFSLGQSVDPVTNEVVEGIAFIHKKSNDVKSNNVGGPKPKVGSTCYTVMAAGAKWKNVENYAVFPGGLDSNYVLNNTASNISKWESAANFSNILGSGSLGAGSPSDPNVLDDRNEITFGHIDSNGTIAVTIVWGTFSGPTNTRRIVAWDQIFNTDYVWSMDATGSTTEMDFENISTHELGHAMGMSHPSGTCTQETMYAYANYGEIIKRDLNAGDIAGINTLY